MTEVVNNNEIYIESLKSNVAIHFNEFKSLSIKYLNLWSIGVNGDIDILGTPEDVRELRDKIHEEYLSMQAANKKLKEYISNNEHDENI